MWARAYRDDHYHGAVDTNNGTEALNKALKYRYLPRTKSMSLSGVATLLVEQFVPDMRQMYVFKNYKQSSAYRAYNDKLVPLYLQGRPRQVILHCLERKARSHKFPAQGIKEVRKGTFEITKESGGKHTVDFGNSNDNLPSCTCRDWKRWHLPCKHFFAVFHSYSQWNWEALPKQYLQSSYLTQDTSAIQSYLTSRTDQSVPRSLDDNITAEFCPPSEPQSQMTAAMDPLSEIPRRTKVSHTKPCKNNLLLGLAVCVRRGCIIMEYNTMICIMYFKVSMLFLFK